MKCSDVTVVRLIMAIIPVVLSAPSSFEEQRKRHRQRYWWDKLNCAK